MISIIKNVNYLEEVKREVEERERLKRNPTHLLFRRGKKERRES